MPSPNPEMSFSPQRTPSSNPEITEPIQTMKPDLPSLCDLRLGTPARLCDKSEK